MMRKPEPDLMGLYLRHCAIGFGLSAVFVALLLAYDIGRIGALVAGSDLGWLAVLMLWLFHGALFGAVQFGVSVMLAARDDDDDDDYRGGRMIPLRVVAGRRREGAG